MKRGDKIIPQPDSAPDELRELLELDRSRSWLILHNIDSYLATPLEKALQESFHRKSVDEFLGLGSDGESVLIRIRVVPNAEAQAPMMRTYCYHGIGVGKSDLFRYAVQNAKLGHDGLSLTVVIDCVGLVCMWESFERWFHDGCSVYLESSRPANTGVDVAGKKNSEEVAA
ncbi:MAG: hypothetical protein QM496_01825 [Verrucomicrobiota bacterium]